MPVTDHSHVWDSGERVPAEPHNTLYLELLSAYEITRKLAGKGIVLNIGCGAGYGSVHVAHEHRLVLGIDNEARWNRLTSPQRMSLESFHLSSHTGRAYSLFALCGQAPLPERWSEPAGWV